MKRILIVIVLIVFCAGIAGYVALQYAKNNQGVVAVKALQLAAENLDKIDVPESTRPTLSALTDMAQDIFVVDGQLRRYLVLLQNNMELRPGGGFVGQYAIVEIKDAEILHWEINDANHLDKDVVSDIAAPAAYQKWLKIPKMEFRDSNWELDFPTNAERAKHLYNKGPTPKEFDGVVAVNASILEDLLAVSGPVTVPDYEDKGEFVAGEARLLLQDIVEKPFLLAEMREECRKREKKTGIEESCSTDPETGEKIKKVTNADRENRKQILPFLAKAIGQKLFGTGDLPWKERFDLARSSLTGILLLTAENLGDRDIQFWFADVGPQDIVMRENWGTVVDTTWDGDYVAVVDANLGALKTDYHIKRTLEYTVDFTGAGAEINDVSAGRMIRYRTPEIQSAALSRSYQAGAPLATMRMSYAHTAEKADYRTSDYHAYTRLYVPGGSSWKVREWFFAPDIETDVFGGKTAFGYKYDIFIGDTLPTMLQYTLPETITEENYQLKIQTQPGVDVLPTTVTIIMREGQRISETFDITRDVIVRLVGEGDAQRLEVDHI